MKKTSCLFICSAFLLCLVTHLTAREINNNNMQSESALASHFQETTIKKTKRSRVAKNDLVDFVYTETPLIDIVTSLAAQKGINVILPVGPDAIAQKVTLQLDKRIPLDEAWNILLELLEMAGYAIVQHNQTYTITKITPQISTEPLPLYVGIPPTDLPDNDMRIRYVYYLANLKITNETQSEVTEVIRALLPDTAKIITNQAANCIILVDTARNIKAAMDVVVSLDKTDFQETIEFLPLRYVPAKTVAELFGEILKTNQQTSRYRLDTRPTASTFFSQYIRIVPEERTNSLILLGRAQAVARVREFIQNNIDVELDSGRSILHIYKLQYLDAQSFAQVLQRIVTSAKAGGTGQSAAGGASSSTERFFQDVIIRADTTSKGSATEGEYQYYGGNNLIIAANNEDWIRIRKLIEQLDIPQPQVIIEVLIADLDINDLRLLGSTVRNPCELPLPGTLDAQSAQATGVVVQPLPSEGTPKTIQADLLAFDSVNNTTPALSGVDPGTTVIAFSDRNDGRTWSLTQIRQTFEDRKIIDNPHVTVTNNQKAIITLGESRLLPDQSTAAEGGTTQVNRKWIPANLILEITPRISSANTVNLSVNINIDRYENPTTNTIGDPNAQAQNNIANRQVVTNANVHDQDVLALGGLTRLENIISLRRVPILGRLPLIGYWFKNRQTEARKTNLTVFISPTIVNPRLRAGTSEYTQAYIAESKDQIKIGTLFDSLRDPITRFFFNPANNDDQIETLDRFVEKDEFKRQEIAFGDIERAEFGNSMKHVVIIREERQFKDPLPPGYNELSEPTPITGTESTENNIISQEQEFPEPPDGTQDETSREPRGPGSTKRPDCRKHRPCFIPETLKAPQITSPASSAPVNNTGQLVQNKTAAIVTPPDKDTSATADVTLPQEQVEEQIAIIVPENNNIPSEEIVTPEQTGVQVSEEALDTMAQQSSDTLSASQILADDRLQRMKELLAEMDNSIFES